MRMCSFISLKHFFNYSRVLYYINKKPLTIYFKGTHTHTYSHTYMYMYICMCTKHVLSCHSKGHEDRNPDQEVIL